MANKTIISINSPDPKWAVMLFRIAILLATTINTAIYAAPGFSESLKLAIMYWSGVMVTFLWALSKILGVKLPDDQPKQFAEPITDPKEPPAGPKPID